MRYVLVCLIAAITVDLLAFNGRYSVAAWKTTKYEAEHFTYEVRAFLRRRGL